MRKDGGMNRRITPRHRVLGHGQIIAKGVITNCVIRDLSDTGAKLGVSHKAKLPQQFNLIPEEWPIENRNDGLGGVERQGAKPGTLAPGKEDGLHFNLPLYQHA